MARDYNINIAVGGGNRRGAFSGGNVYKTKNTLNSKIGNDGDAISRSNLSRVFTVGLAFNIGQKGNEVVGAYTSNKLRQRKFDTSMTFTKYGIGIAINPAVGGAYALGDMVYRGVQYGIKVQKKNREADYFQRLSGNTSSSGRRYGGGIL